MNDQQRQDYIHQLAQRELDKLDSIARIATEGEDVLVTELVEVVRVQVAVREMLKREKR